MRDIYEAVRRRDHDQVKRDPQSIYQVGCLAEARQAFRAFRRYWGSVYSRLVKSLEKDLPELLNFFLFPKRLWKKLRTTNAIDRCFVEVRRRTRPMVVFTSVQSVDRIIYAIFNRFNGDWQNRTLEHLTQ
jgi:transposase-like protein